MTASFTNHPLPKANQLQPEHGFTLVEVIVAMMILAVISVTAWYSFEGIARLKEAAEVSEVTTNSARVALQRISREVRAAFLTRNSSIQGHYLTAMWGDNQQDLDKLTFNSFSHIRLYRDSKEADTTEITYFTETDPANPGQNLLLHREADRIDGQPDDGGTIEVLARGVAQFNLRYYDAPNEEWLESWDSTSLEYKRKLPRAIEVSLVLVDPEGAEQAYATTILLPMNTTQVFPRGEPDAKRTNP